MSKLISNSLMPALKWGTVIVATAVVVISIQVNADGNMQQSAAKAEKAVLLSGPKAADKSAPWTPTAGFADLIDQVSPAVVHVAIRGTVGARNNFPQFNFPPGSPFEDFFEEFRERQQPNQRERSRPLGIGSGFIISEDGYVVTNYHVVKDADEIIVTLTDGEEYEAELKGSDDRTDLALLKLKKAKDLPYVAWGDADKSRVGDWVVAIGNPFGLGGSASTGIISARGRDINSGPYDDYIQVDAAINRGNSGGPLFNLKGEVIGINTAIYSPNGGSVGIGFSIPSNMAENVIAQLRDSGEVERAFIGVEIQPVTDELAGGFGRDDDHGALVSRVQPGKPAADAGVKTGDIILSFDGEEVKEMRDLPKIVAQSPVGKKSKMVVWRNGAEKIITIKTARLEDNAVAGSSSSSDEIPEVEKGGQIGATLSGLSDELRQRYNIDGDIEGVLVLRVNAEGLAALNGLRAGDVLTQVDNVKVTDPDAVSTIIRKARESERKIIVVLLQRNNTVRFIPFNLNDE